MTWFVVLSAIAVLLTCRLLVQRCPHCSALVARSYSRRWSRCRHCHRQYNRMVPRLRS
jgi:primosomal protein N'